MIEITVISAQGIKNTSSFNFCFFSHHLKPFITITTFPPPPFVKGGNRCHVYSTRVDDEGGPNPTWGDKFHLPLDPTFFTSGKNSCVHLQLCTMRAVLGPDFLGWIQIPASDILDGLSPTSAHHLSYRLREKDGSKGHGVVNVALRFVGDVPVAGGFAAVDTWRTSIGIPVTMCPMTCRLSTSNNKVELENEKNGPGPKWFGRL